MHSQSFYCVTKLVCNGSGASPPVCCAVRFPCCRGSRRVSWLPPGNTRGSQCRESSKPLGRLRSSTLHALQKPKAPKLTPVSSASERLGHMRRTPGGREPSIHHTTHSVRTRSPPRARRHARVPRASKAPVTNYRHACHPPAPLQHSHARCDSHMRHATGGTLMKGLGRRVEERVRDSRVN
jgi:hypothetical protein